MKKNILLFATTFTLFSAALALSSCGGSTEKKDQPNETNPVSKDSTKATAYVCPMGPECGKGETAGKCPSCGMDMVQNTKGLK